MCNMDPVLSIITPTYNRGYLLVRCHESLLAQTEKNFEWIIVDDGSSDNTEQIVRSFSSPEFSVVYVKKENGGKHTALNASHPYIHGKYVLILDSDDYLVPTAVEQVINGWERYICNADVGIVTFLKGSSAANPNCTAPVADEPVDILRHKRTITHSSDCCEVILADLFKQYPFPVFPGERFVAECALWNRVAWTHKCVYINDVIYICNYLEGGLTDSGRSMRIRNPRGGMVTSNLRMSKKNYVLQRIKYGILYNCYGFFAELSILDILKQTKHKMLATMCLLPGYILFLCWKKRYM